MKAGTGVLMHLLNQHPLLISGKGENGSNEIHFFKSSRLHREENYFPCSSRDAWTYLMRFPDFRYKTTDKQTGNYKKTFDKSPDYMRSRGSIRAMQLMLPSAKLIVLLRNPATRAISEFNHNCRHGRYFRSSRNAANFGSIRHLHDLSKGDVTSLSHQVLRYPCSLEDFREYFFGGPNGRQLRTYARKEASHGYYAQQMQWLLESFPARQVLVLFQEEMAGDTLGTLKAVERFIDVPHHRYSSDVHQSHSKIASGNAKLYDHLVREELEALYRPHNLQLLRLLSHAFNRSSLPREWGDLDKDEIQVFNRSSFLK